ncbi:hypothetical protein EPYR_02435 [Erwinia pyrifoliae DSM 12163]|nr:hypothetical protein EPYR_02435 [Erwinia pyrifoliae DSM 12163]
MSVSAIRSCNNRRQKVKKPAYAGFFRLQRW